jgi:hypothetical protein
VRVIFNLTIFAAVALLVGLGTARVMITTGSAVSTARFGPWTAWHSLGAASADPYTLAHVSRSGTLPVTSSSAIHLTARVDENGDLLNSRCDYAIIVPPVPAQWWSLSVFDKSGQPIPNPSDRHSFSSENVVAAFDGSVRFRVAPRARPGYWLPSGDAGQLTLVFRVFRPREAVDLASGELSPDLLPRITTVGCS